MSKICVYAICKNEMKFADRWLNSLSAADYIVVLDTGSTDGTYEYLQQDDRVYKVEQKIIEPWRFDVARNESMKLIPADVDICVVSDFDQTFRPGWDEELKRLFALGYEEVYGDIIDYTDDNIEIKRFLSKNVHPNSSDWHWERPIHEGVYYYGDRDIKTYTSDSFVIEHHPDYNKSRGGYLKLLEAEYKENSKDPMCAIYYGCELCFHDREKEGFEVFLKAEEECDFSSCPEIGCQIMLNISDSYRIREEYDKAIEYINKAISYNIITRRLMVQAADTCFDAGWLEDARDWIERAIAIKFNYRSWIELSIYWESALLYDKAALIYYGLGSHTLAAAYGALACQIEPDNERLKNNLYFYMEAFNNEEK